MDCGLGECLGDPLDLARKDIILFRLFRSLLELCTVAGRRGTDVAPRCRGDTCAGSFPYVYVSKLEPAPWFAGASLAETAFEDVLGRVPLKTNCGFGEGFMMFLALYCCEVIVDALTCADL